MNKIIQRNTWLYPIQDITVYYYNAGIFKLGEMVVLGVLVAVSSTTSLAVPSV